MTEGGSSRPDQANGTDATGDWPSFALRYTFNPDRSVRRERFDPDELFVFDPDHADGETTRWISAERGSYVTIEEVR